MAEIQIRIKNLPQIRAAFNASPKLMKVNLSRAIPLSLRAVAEDEEFHYASMGIGVISGRLLSSIRRGIDYRPGTLRGEVGPNTSNFEGYDKMLKPWHGISHYAVFVHDGTKRMKKRPFLQRAVATAQPEIDKLFQKATQDTLNQIGKMI